MGVSFLSLFLKSEALCSEYARRRLMWNIVFDVLLAVCAVELWLKAGWYYALLCAAVAVAMHAFDITKRAVECRGFLIIAAAVIGLYAAGFVLIRDYFGGLNPFLTVLYFAVNFLSAWRILCFVLKEMSEREYLKRFARLLLCTATLNFIVIIYLSTNMFAANYTDFNFPYQSFMPTFLIVFAVLSVASAALLAPLKNRAAEVVISLFLGLTAGIYIQYMFMNDRLESIGTQEFDWSRYSVFSVINAVIWAVIIAVPFVLLKLAPKLWKRASVIFPTIMLALHILSTLIILFTAPKEIYGELKTAYMSAEEQYVVSKNKNIVVFVIDAADNTYFDELLANSPAVFEGLEDFTLYTNTCSVYDSTYTSFAQMFGGAEFDNTITSAEWFDRAWNSEKTVSFYNELHELNYRVNAYNMFGGDEKLWKGKLDNVVENEKPVRYKVSQFHWENFSGKYARLIAYQLLPFAAKKYTSAERIVFNDIAAYETQKMNYYNREFMANLNLKLSDSDENYLIIEHINGTHFPCEFIDETKYCLNISKEYISQMKALGVYDDATIILTSDHGQHSDATFGSTPIFMIKEPHSTHRSMQFNDSPIYHTDIMSTIAVNAGIYSADEENKLYGRSIYDFSPDDKRERVFYDRMFDPAYPSVKTGTQIDYVTNINVYYAYRYTGDDDVLRDMVSGGRVSEIYPMKEFCG